MVVKRTVSVDMMLEDVSLPFLLVVAAATTNRAPKIYTFFYIATSSAKVSSVSPVKSGAYTPSCGVSEDIA